jgi:hypothetical protein
VKCHELFLFGHWLVAGFILRASVRRPDEIDKEAWLRVDGAEQRVRMDLAELRIK